MIKKGMYTGVFTVLAILNFQPVGAENICLCKLQQRWEPGFEYLESSMPGCTIENCRNHCEETSKKKPHHYSNDSSAIGCVSLTPLITK